MLLVSLSHRQTDRIRLRTVVMVIKTTNTTGEQFNEAVWKRQSTCVKTSKDEKKLYTTENPKLKLFEKCVLLRPVFFLRRFEEPKRSLKIVQRSLKICFYNSVNKAKYAQEQ